MVLRVVSYNVRYFGHGTRGLASTAKSMGRIAQALAHLTPLADVICLQEVETTSLRSNLAHPAPDGETQLERFMQMLHRSLLQAGRRDTYEAYYFPAHTYRFSVTPIYTTGLAVVARSGFNVSHHNAGTPHDITYRHIHPVKRLKQTRICAHLRVEHASGVDLDVFNTHLSLPTTLSREFWFEPRRMGWGPNQIEEAKNLAKFVATERKSERFVVCGDFNALPGSPVYRTLIASGLSDPFARHHRFDEDALVRWPTAGFMNMRMHLDHVFSGGALRWTDFEGTHRFGQRNGLFRGLSDHVPIVGSFTLDAGGG
ncbi:MAG: endonuclease/exonuclease/phosphatase family protein [Labilithrix sp.]|nr:endonuclease/exonuclease/phosphatase family protein [Labilithrix sp.]